jgi:primase-polymerase (primpol)-like protein
MKANAPEKIFLHPDIGGRVFIRPWLKRRANQESVEYTRTDAFIEKATKWLMDNIQDYTDDGMGEHSFVLVHDLKEHFKKYMRGE